MEGDGPSPPPAPSGWEAQLQGVDLCETVVDGDNDCAYYAVLDGRRDGTVQHTDLPPDSRRAIASDRRAASDARARVADYLRGPGATAHRNTVGGRLIWCDPACGGCGKDAMKHEPNAQVLSPLSMSSAAQHACAVLRFHVVPEIPAFYRIDFWRQKILRLRIP